MDLNFEKIFKITLTAMKINRSHPAIIRNPKWIIQFFLIHSIYSSVYILLIYNIIFINLKENNFSETCKNGTLCVVYNTITFHFIIMLWKQKHFKILMDNMKRDYDLARSLPEEEQNIIREFARKGQYVCKQWLIISIIGATVFPIKNAALLTYVWITEGEFLYIPFYDLVYPPFLERNKDTFVLFISMYILFFGFACYSAVMYTAFVPLGPILMLHACGQLDLVKNRIEGLFKTDDVMEVKQKLTDIVKQLQYIYDFVDRTKLCFRIAYEMTLKITMLVLPLTCYELKEALKHGEVSFEFMVFIVGGTLISSSPCYYSELLMEKGEEIRLAMYSCDWEGMYNRSIWSSIIIILQRALRPTAINSLFRAVCLEALTDLFQQSFTIFNLMNAMWN